MTANPIKLKKKCTNISITLLDLDIDGVTSPTAKGLLATGHCSNDCSLSALKTEINAGGAKGGFRGADGSASRKGSGLQQLRAPPALRSCRSRGCWLGQSQGGRDVSWATPAGWQQHSLSLQPAHLRADAWHLVLYRSSLFPAVSGVGIFQTKLQGGENPALSMACGSRLSIKVPQPTHGPQQSPWLFGAGPISPDPK